MVHATLAKRNNELSNQSADAGRQILLLNSSNQSLTTKMLGIAESLKADRTEELNDISLSEELGDLDKEIHAARREWRIMKSLVSGIVAGSGVDWAEDNRLLELVLDEDEEVG